MESDYNTNSEPILTQQLALVYETLSQNLIHVGDVLGVRVPAL